MAAELQIRRVGFRSGCDQELKALHDVEALIEAERGSNRMPQALDDYMAFARSLPSQFSDHSLFVETPDGTPITSGYCSFNSAGDERAMECDVLGGEMARVNRESELTVADVDRRMVERWASTGRPRARWHGRSLLGIASETSSTASRTSRPARYSGYGPLQHRRRKHRRSTGLIERNVAASLAPGCVRPMPGFDDELSGCLACDRNIDGDRAGAGPAS